MNEQLQILTVLPKSWSVKKIQQEFGVSTYMAQKSKKLVKEKGVLSLPDQKPGPSLLPETVDIVHAFYESAKLCQARRICISENGGQTCACSKATGSEQLEGGVP